MRLSAIVAMAENMVIGQNNALPWHLPQDLQHFKTLTMGKPVVMGRKTHTAIGKILPGRLNIILTRDVKFFVPEPGVIAHSVAQVLQMVQADAEVCIIGGSEIYKLFMPFLERIYMTLVHVQVSGDSYFPAFQPQEWRQLSNEYHRADTKHQYNYSFICWEKI